MDADFYCMHSELCKTLANDKRQMILGALRDDELSVGQLVERTGIPQANLSQHLSIMRSHGVVSTRRDGTRVIAVGTTVARALESAVDEATIAEGGASRSSSAPSSALRRGPAETRLFIRPGFRFRVIDGLITNFHLPGSTLLMLVAAYAGHERVLQAYAHAVQQRYRFFSYGDAMLVWPAPGVRS